MESGGWKVTRFSSVCLYTDFVTKKTARRVGEPSLLWEWSLKYHFFAVDDVDALVGVNYAATLEVVNGNGAVVGGYLVDA